MTDAIERINQLRQMVVNGEEISKEESAEAIRLLRESRAKVTEKSVLKAEKAAPLDLNSLFAKKE